MNILHYSDKSSTDFLQLYQSCDVLLYTGDLSYFDFHGLADTEVKKPAFGVHGNHDPSDFFPDLHIINLHNTVYEYAGLRWGGFQGCLRYKKSGDFQFSEDDAELWATSFPAVDVLLLHAGGRDLLDDPSDDVHIGSDAVRRYILDKKPKFVFCGHQYSDDEMTVGETRIFRTYGARMIEI